MKRNIYVLIKPASSECNMRCKYCFYTDVASHRESRYCIYAFPEENKVLTCLRNILREMQDREMDHQTVCQAYMDILVVQLIRNTNASMTHVPGHSPTNRQCASVRHYIDNHYKEKLSLEMLAETVSVNKYYLAHTFKEEYGVSPINYLLACRFREGKRLLAETDLSLTQISSVLGFSSPSYFSQSFRKAEGVSPMEFRKQHQPK